MLLAVGFSGLQQARTQGASINLIIKDHHLEPRVLTLLCNWLGRMGPSVRDLRLDTDAAPSTLILVAANGRTALGFCKWDNSAGLFVQDLRSESGRRPSTEVSSRG